MQELSIKVTIAERQYPLKIQASDEENVRKAAKKVNEKLKEYTDLFAVSDKQDALAVIALELAAELEERSGNAAPDEQSERILQSIEQRLDQLLHHSK